VGSVKSGLRYAACRLLGPLLRHVPVRRWPAWAGSLFEIKVPANVARRAVTAPDGGANINVIFDLLDRVRHLPGDLAECGVFRGATLIPAALDITRTAPDKQIVGFDSFAGFDSAIKADLAMGGDTDDQKREGGFNQTSRAFVASRTEALGLGRNVHLMQGYFEQTLPAAPERRYCFVHLDCDIYASYRQCLAYFFPRMTPGGILLLDEYNDPPWPGCNKAVDEFLAERSETVQPIAHDGYEKFYIVKS